LPRKTKTKTTPHDSSRDGFWFDEAAAIRACEFFEKFLRHAKGEWAGQRFALSEWQQRNIIRPIFGWKRPDGTRKYRKVYVEVPRKNGKSTLGAGIALYLLFSDGEPGAEIYSAAADREQAAIIFDVAKQMVEQDPELRSRCEVFRRSIAVGRTGSAYHVLSADAPTKHGKNSHGVLFDELHAQPNRELYDVLKTSTGSRRQPLFVMFTTAGYDKTSICWEEHEYATRLLSGVIQDDTYLPIIFAADQDEDWTDPKVWARANPGLDKSVKIQYLQDECNRAKESPAYQNTFRRLHLNQWTEQATRFLDMAAWDECAGQIDPAEFKGCPCWAGLDLASTIDITAFVLCFANEDGGYTWLPFFWVPEEAIQKRSTKDRIQYDVWEKMGFIESTPGNVCDYDHIRERIKQMAEVYRIQEIAYDRWNASQLVTQLMNDGATMVPFGQGYQSMNAPTKELLTLVTGRKLRHGGNPVLRWMASNVAAKQDPADNLKPDKAKSSEKIDGIVAGIMALGRAMVGSGKPQNIYEVRGPVFV
jgi:phage terminase large subunit-like protein